MEATKIEIGQLLFFLKGEIVYHLPVKKIISETTKTGVATNLVFESVEILISADKCFEEKQKLFDSLKVVKKEDHDDLPF